VTKLKLARFAALVVVTPTLAVACLFGAALPASAHSTLVSSSPADGSTVTQAPAQVVLTFNENIIAVGDAVSVVSPSGKVVSTGAAVVLNATVTQRLGQLTENGLYQMSYRITSADGHVVTRTLSFTLNVPGLPSVTATPSASTSGGSGISTTVIVLIVVAVVVVGAGIFGLVSYNERSKRREDAEDEFASTAEAAPSEPDRGGS